MEANPNTEPEHEVAAEANPNTEPKHEVAAEADPNTEPEHEVAEEAVAVPADHCPDDHVTLLQQGPHALKRGLVTSRMIWWPSMCLLSQQTRVT